MTCESFALWYAVADENGQQGYVYTGDIQLKKNGELQSTNAAEEAVKQKFALLREKLPEEILEPYGYRSTFRGRRSMVGDRRTL